MGGRRSASEGHGRHPDGRSYDHRDGKRKKGDLKRHHPSRYAQPRGPVKIHPAQAKNTSRTPEKVAIGFVLLNFYPRSAPFALGKREMGGSLHDRPQVQHRGRVFVVQRQRPLPWSTPLFTCQRAVSSPATVATRRRLGSAAALPNLYRRRFQLSAEKSVKNRANVLWASCPQPRAKNMSKMLAPPLGAAAILPAVASVHDMLWAGC